MPNPALSANIFRIVGLIPFLAVAFINAFVDLGHKIIVQNTVFKVYDQGEQVIYTAVLNGLILLPYLLLFSPSGFLSDRFHKPRILRATAAIAVGLTLGITYSYYQGWFWAAYAMTFMMGVQSALYAPAKYGYIKELTGVENLTMGNGLIQASTIVAILCGVFAFSILFELRLEGHDTSSKAAILRQIAPIGWILVVFAGLEFVMTWRLPLVGAPDKDLKFEIPTYVRGGYLGDNVNRIYSHRGIWLAIIGLAVFWGIAQVVLASYPALAKERLGEMNTVVIQGLLALSGVGIMIGSLLAGKMSKGHIETGLIPIGAILFVTALAALPIFSSYWLIGFSFITLGIGGGLFIVPLNALIQFHSHEDQLGVVIAGSNWVQNIVMLLFLGLSIAFALGGATTLGLFQLLIVAGVIGMLYTLYQLPQSLVRFVAARVISSRYRVKVHGFDHLPNDGAVLMLGNHISWLDWAIIQIASPRPVRFVMHRQIYGKWAPLRWFFDQFGVIPVSSGASKSAIRAVNDALRRGEVVCLFPEGSISYSGQLAEFRGGFEHMVDEVDGVILPFYLRGLWGSSFSRSGETLKSRPIRGLRREIICAFGAPMPIDSKADAVKRRVFDLSIDAWQEHTAELEPIALSWIRTVKRNGGRPAMIDTRGDTELSGRKALTAALALSGLIGKESPEPRIGLLLPTSSGGLLANMAALLAGKTLVNLNYTASSDAIGAAIRKAAVKTVYTSSKFRQKLAQRGIELEAVLADVKVIDLEDLMPRISAARKLLTLLAVTLLPARLLHWMSGDRKQLEDEAAILFSSGSEGEPKGVVLSQRNIMGNIAQVTDVLDPTEQDRMLATLPLFHAFGLTITGLLPLLQGMPVVTHADPTDSLGIAKAVARHRATIYCATATFLRFLVRNRRVEPLMLDSLRLVVAGAERLPAEIREAFKLKFNKDIHEGYGTTETTPVAGVNVPDRIAPDDLHVQVGNRPGTVGMPLPGASYRIVDPANMQELPTGEDGLILIGGTQVMTGYLDDPERTADVIVELDDRRWYKSGDKGHLDEDGFLTIVDRYSRFAKIGGEMVSLGAVEAAAAAALPEEIEVLATAIPDGRKGEKVVLLFSGELSEDEIGSTLRGADINSLMLPGGFLRVDEIPKLGTGKNDYSTARQLAAE